MEASSQEADFVEKAKRGSASGFEALLRMHQTVAYRSAVAAANEGDRHAVQEELFAAAQRFWCRLTA